MPFQQRRRAIGAAAAGVLLAGTLLAGCGGGSSTPPVAAGKQQPAAGSQQEVAPRPVAPLTRRSRADVLVTATKPIPATVVSRLATLRTAAAYTRIATGPVKVGVTSVRAVAVDPSAFRRFAPEGTAESTAVWDTIARGEMAVAHATAARLRLRLGSVVVVAAGTVQRELRIGALATTLPGADVVVDRSVGAVLRLLPNTGIVLSARGADSAGLAAAARKAAGRIARIDLLTAPKASPLAFLTGPSAARAFGAFSYRYHPDGTIEPDAEWVRANIRYERVPILGVVTCHRLMIPQLRAALNDVARAGLAKYIDARQYGGCYVPRFIERNPERSISLHTWGIAVDLNVPGNLPGSPGTMHPGIVRIFKQWGFRWGGDWSYPDPMHFELAALLTSRRG